MLLVQRHPIYVKNALENTNCKNLKFLARVLIYGLYKCAVASARSPSKRVGQAGCKVSKLSVAEASRRNVFGFLVGIDQAISRAHLDRGAKG